MWLARYGSFKIFKHDQWLHSVSIIFIQESVCHLSPFLFFRLAVTKLDILDELDEIKVAISYELDGKTLLTPPGMGVVIQLRIMSLILSLLP